MQFIPTGVAKTSTLPDVPWFEDSPKHEIKGHSSTKSVRVLQDEVERELAELGGFRVRFHEGDYKDGNRTRHGFRVEFIYNGYPARIDVAALPIRAEHVPAKKGAMWRATPAMKERALGQALFLLRDWLYAEHVSWVYRPSAMPLLPYITGEDGRTVIEVMSESGNLPLLGSAD